MESKKDKQRALRDLDLAQEILFKGILTCKERMEIEEAFNKHRQEIQQGILPVKTEGEE